MTIRQQVGLAAALMALGIARALPAQEAVLRTRERAAMLTEFRALLEHTDAATRMAAFEEAMSGKDQALKTMAMDAAFASSDENLKTAALRTYLDGRKTLPITVILPERASEAVAKEFTRWNALVLNEVKVADNVITGTSNANETFGGGQLVAGGFTLRFQRYSSGNRCSLEAKVVGPKQLAGRLDCTYTDSDAAALGRRVTFPIRIDLP